MVVVWDLHYSFWSPIFEIPSRKAITRVQTAKCPYLTKFKWPYFDSVWCYSHTVGRAGSPTCIVYVDVTLTQSKVKVKVTELLNFRQLPKTAHFCMELKTGG